MFNNQIQHTRENRRPQHFDQWFGVNWCVCVYVCVFCISFCDSAGVSVCCVCVVKLFSFWLHFNQIIQLYNNNILTLDLKTKSLLQFHWLFFFFFFHWHEVYVLWVSGGGCLNCDSFHFVIECGYSLAMCY